MAKTLDSHHGAAPPRQPSKADVILGGALVIMAILHIAMILCYASPYVDLCIVLVPIGPYFWPTVAILLALWTVSRAADLRFGSLKRLRLSIAAMLVLFAIDTLTGGNYRWFEIAMSRQMAKVGGPAALQAWAQKTLGSSEKVEAFEKDGGGMVDPSRVPPNLQHWFGHGGPLYRMRFDGGPVFQFDDGGWDMGWGVMVGRTDLAKALPRGANGGDCWTKQLQSGVFLYAF